MTLSSSSSADDEEVAEAELLVEPTVILTITCDEAMKLFEFFQDTNAFNFWETPLSPLAEQLKSHYLYGCPDGCSWSQ